MRQTLAGTALLVTAQPGRAYRLCKEMIVLNRGQVLRAAKPKAVFAGPASGAAASAVPVARTILPCTPLDSRNRPAGRWGNHLLADGCPSRRLQSPRASAPTTLPLRCGCAQRHPGKGGLHHEKPPLDWNLIATSRRSVAAVVEGRQNSLLGPSAPDRPSICVPPGSIMPLKQDEKTNGLHCVSGYIQWETIILKIGELPPSKAAAAR